MKKTKQKYEECLNECSPEQGSDKWIIGDKLRMAYMWKRKYGTALRKYEPITFRVGYNDWKYS